MISFEYAKRRSFLILSVKKRAQPNNFQKLKKNTNNTTLNWKWRFLPRTKYLRVCNGPKITNNWRKISKSLLKWCQKRHKAVILRNLRLRPSICAWKVFPIFLSIKRITIKGLWGSHCHIIWGVEIRKSFGISWKFSCYCYHSIFVLSSFLILRINEKIPAGTQKFITFSN